MKRFKTGLAAGCLVGLLASAAQATTYVKSFTLTGDQETPPVATPGLGASTVTMEVDSVTHTFSWTIVYGGLTTPVTVAHFYGPAAPGQAAPPVVDVSLPAPFSNQGFTTGSTILSDAQMQQVLSGLWYLNIHTEANPNGEIRGQLPAMLDATPSPVPEPAALSLFGVGVAALAARLRKH